MSVRSRRGLGRSKAACAEPIAGFTKLPCCFCPRLQPACRFRLRTSMQQTEVWGEGEGEEGRAGARWNVSSSVKKRWPRAAAASAAATVLTFQVPHRGWAGPAVYFRNLALYYYSTIYCFCFKNKCWITEHRHSIIIFLTFTCSNNICLCRLKVFMI